MTQPSSFKCGKKNFLEEMHTIMCCQTATGHQEGSLWKLTCRNLWLIKFTSWWSQVSTPSEEYARQIGSSSPGNYIFWAVLSELEPCCVFSGVELSRGAGFLQPQFRFFWFAAFGKSFSLVRDGWELFRVAYLKNNGGETFQTQVFFHLKHFEMFGTWNSWWLKIRS